MYLSAFNKKSHHTKYTRRSHKAVLINYTPSCIYARKLKPTPNLPYGRYIYANDEKDACLPFMQVIPHQLERDRCVRICQIIRIFIAL